MMEDIGEIKQELHIPEPPVPLTMVYKCPCGHEDSYDHRDAKERWIYKGRHKYPYSYVECRKCGEWLEESMVVKVIKRSKMTLREIKERYWR